MALAPKAKLGLTVTWPGRNGSIRRTLVAPRNPRSGAQQVIRQSLSTQAAACDQLTEAQQEAWIAAAAQIQSKPTLGQSGPLTGLQWYARAEPVRRRKGRSRVGHLNSLRAFGWERGLTEKCDCASRTNVQ